MLASPITYLKPVTTRQQLPQAKPTTASAARILCFKLQKPEGVKLSWNAIGESFLKFSPRVQIRIEQPAKVAASVGEGSSAWFFLDIASTAHLFCEHSMLTV